MPDLQRSEFYYFVEWPEAFDSIYDDVEVLSLCHIYGGWSYNPKHLLKGLRGYLNLCEYRHSFEHNHDHALKPV
jgi:hypothetical protein